MLFYLILVSVVILIIITYLYIFYEVQLQNYKNLKNQTKQALPRKICVSLQLSEDQTNY